MNPLIGPRTRSTTTRHFGATLTLALALLGASTIVTGGAAVTARAQRGPAVRTVEGKVESKAGEPIKGAVVYLKDDHSQSVRSAISGDGGVYRFVQLAQSTDYEIWAQVDDKRSKSRTISSFDSRPGFNFTLTIDK